MKNRATGLIHREARTFNTRTEAQDWAQALEADLRRGQHNDLRLLDATPLRDLIQRYVDEESPKKLGAAQEIVRLKKWLASDLADRPVSRCLPVQFADHVRVRRKQKSARSSTGKISDQTIKLELIALSNVFEVARKDWGYTNLENPIKKISKPKGSGTREVRIPFSIWPKLAEELGKCRNHNYVTIAELALETGMRQDELMRMAWGDIDLKNRRIRVEGKDTSAPGQRKQRIVPISRRADELLRSLPRSTDKTMPIFQIGGATSADGLSRAFSAACEAAGIKGGVFHCTRHEAASRMAPHYNMLTLMKIFGWKTPSMAARYYHASDDELLAGVDRMQGQVKTG
jgi:integrase